MKDGWAYTGWDGGKRQEEGPRKQILGRERRALRSVCYAKILNI